MITEANCSRRSASAAGSAVRFARCSPLGELTSPSAATYKNDLVNNQNVLPGLTWTTRSRRSSAASWTRSTGRSASWSLERGRPLRPVPDPGEGLAGAHGSDLAARPRGVPRAAGPHPAHQLRPRLPRAHAGGARHQPADVRGHAARQPDLRAETLDTVRPGGGLLALRAPGAPDGHGLLQPAPRTSSTRSSSSAPPRSSRTSATRAWRAPSSRRRRR